MDQFIESFFQPIGQQDDPTIVQNNIIGRGSLVSFSYSQWVHDPKPLVIISDYQPGIRIRGINLHYLTFHTIAQLIKTNCDNLAFSYRSVSGDKYVTSAFRTYKWHGIKQIKKLDCDVLMRIMKVNRTEDPNQTEAIRQNVREQLNQQMNQKSEYYNQDYYNPNYNINSQSAPEGPSQWNNES